MTTRYLEYLDGITNGTISIDDVYFNVKLVSDEYVPNESHKHVDVQKYIIAALGVMTANDVKKLTMSEILDRAKELLKEGLTTYQDIIKDQIDVIISDKIKREKLKELISSGDNNYQFWQDLKDNGIGYFVFESAPDGVLTWCEEVTG